MSDTTYLLSNMAHRAAVTAQPSLVSTLREYALALGWDAALVSGLTLEIHGPDVQVKMDPSHKTEIQNEEYGTQTAPPKPAIRLFMSKLPELLRPYFAKELSMSMVELVDTL